MCSFFALGSFREGRIQRFRIWSSRVNKTNNGGYHGPDRRSGTERRQGERRGEVRYEPDKPDRRSGVDRRRANRGNDVWSLAHGQDRPGTEPEATANAGIDFEPVPAGAPSVRHVTHAGGCHCGRVRFEVDGPAKIQATRCNCSVCRMSAYLHMIVPATRFRLLQGRDALSSYTFNTRTARHFFCKHCGIKSFYVPRSHPDGFSINVRCLDPATIESVRTTDFDGHHWEENAHRLESG